MYYSLASPSLTFAMPYLVSRTGSPALLRHLSCDSPRVGDIRDTTRLRYRYHPASLPRRRVTRDDQETQHPSSLAAAAATAAAATTHRSVSPAIRGVFLAVAPAACPISHGACHALFVVPFINKCLAHAPSLRATRARHHVRYCAGRRRALSRRRESRGATRRSCQYTVYRRAAAINGQYTG